MDEFLAHLHEAAPDLLICPGDVHSDVDEAFRWLSEFSRAAGCPTLFVLGNRDYAGRSRDETISIYRDMSAGCRVLLMEKDSMELQLKGQILRVFGSTFWSPDHNGKGPLDEKNEPEPHPSLARAHKEACSWLEREIRQAKPDVFSVVVTHHPPTADILQKTEGMIDLWVSGHTHLNRMDEINETLLVSRHRYQRGSKTPAIPFVPSTIIV